MTMWLEYLKIYDKINLRKDKISKEKMVMRKIRRRRNKQRKIIVISLTCFLFIMVGGYAAFQTNLNITAKGNIAQKSRVIQSWTNTDNTDFHSDYYKENIVSATFLDNNDIPSNAVESWNVSEDKEHGGVMAWVVQNSEDNTKYDLYIGVDGGVIANEDSGWLFFAFLNLANIEFNNNFDTSNVTNMDGMFGGGNSLVTLDIGSFDTSNVVSMVGMFTYWNTVTQDWKGSILEGIIGLNSFNTKNVISMQDMFSGISITALDLSNFDTSNVTNMYHMFNNSKNLEILNICGFNTFKVTDMREVFLNTPGLQTIKVGPNWTTDNANTTYMFTNSGVSGVTTGQC